MSVGTGDRPVDVPLAQNTTAARVSMAIMAASMAYMFAAMQLMRMVGEPTNPRACACS
jgi:hypothetical protein